MLKGYSQNLLPFKVSPAGLQIPNISSQGGHISCFCLARGMPGRIIWPATRHPFVCRGRPTSILSVDKFMLCLCLVFRPFEISLLFFSFTVDCNKKPSGGERSGYNLFYSRLARNSAVDGWTPIYPHLGVINVNGLVEVCGCVSRPGPRVASRWPLPADVLCPSDCATPGRMPACHATNTG